MSEDELKLLCTVVRELYPQYIYYMCEPTNPIILTTSELKTIK